MISVTTRYYWTKLEGLPPRVELIDSVSAHAVAVIFQIARRWHWKRNTTVLLHGAASAEGTAVSLGEAKRQAIEGLAEGVV
jgi:hypothetical protein